MADVKSQESAKELDNSRKKGAEAAQKKSSPEGNEAGVVRKEMKTNDAEAQQPKKKKNIIIVSNQPNVKIPGQAAGSGARSVGKGNYSTQTGYSGSAGSGRSSRPNSQGGQGGSRQGSQNGQSGSNGPGGRVGNAKRKPDQGKKAAAAPVRPIKPLTPPSPTPSVQMMPSKPVQSAKPKTTKPEDKLIQEKKPEVAVATPAVEEKAPAVAAAGMQEQRNSADTVREVAPVTGTDSVKADKSTAAPTGTETPDREGNAGAVKAPAGTESAGARQNIDMPQTKEEAVAADQSRAQNPSSRERDDRSQDSDNRDGNRESRSRGRSQDGSREGRSDGRGRDRSADGGRRDGRSQDGSREGSRDGGYRRDGAGRDRSADGGRRDGGRGQDGSRDGYRRDGAGRERNQDGTGYGSRDASRDIRNGNDTRNRDGRYQDRDGRRQDGSGSGRGGVSTERGGSNGRSSYNRTDARPYRQNGEGGQGDRRGGSSYQQAGRGMSGSGRDNRGFQGSDSRSRGQSTSGGFGAEASSKDMEKKREQDKRRISQEKDKRNRKEMMYEEEGTDLKSKPGRFIKPEKKEEVAEEAIKVITLPETISIRDLAEKMRMQPAAIIKKLFLAGKIVTVNQEISYEEAENIAMEYDILCEKEVQVDVIEELLKEDEENEADMVERPPVICVMGHVDHGKTSLLDAIRKTNVTDKEAGGITQHIGAYTVNLSGRSITFLDTPGHEAFTAMRMRGANATDIAVLVVAADDGVMPQTVEAINHAKAAGIEIIVAVNKIDKPSANVERVKQELTEYGLVAEDWGGNTVFAPVSAKTGEGIEQLLEMILLTADIMELKANPKRTARGLVIEAELDKGRGPVATVLVQKGTLHVGDFISAGASYGKVRAMIDDKGRRVKIAEPSTPVEILGLSDVPNAGEVFLAHENDKTAKSYAETYLAQNKEKMLEETRSRMSLDDLFSQIKEGNLKELNLIVKADVQGSVEAVKQSLLKLTNEEIVVKCIHGGVGAINESDVMLAGASNAIIIGFNVRPDAMAKAMAERECVDVRLYKVIYQAIEDIEAAMKGMLDPVYEEKVIGHAEVRQIFKASAIGNIAGSYVLDGVIQRGCKIRITREGEQIYEGELASLKRFKDDVKEVKAGFECGLVFQGFDQMHELDIVEAYVMVEVPR